MRPLAAGLLVSLALVVAGCGGEEAVTGGGAEVVPAEAAVFVSINTDFDSEQWKAAEALLDKFPSGDKVIAKILEELEAEEVSFADDVEPALGLELVVVLLDFPQGESEPAFVALTQPSDRDKLEELLAKGEEAVETADIDGWTAIAETQGTLDRFADGRERGSLADSAAFEEAMDGLPEDAVAKLYVNGKSLKEGLASDPDVDREELEQVERLFTGGGELESLGAALVAEEDGVRFEAVASTEGGELPEPYESKLLSQVPEGALLYVSFNNLEGVLRKVLGETAEGFEEERKELEAGLGISLEEVLPLLADEGGLAVHPGLPFPAGTLLLEVDDEERAVAIVDKIVAGASRFLDGKRAREIEIDGITAKELSLGFFSIIYAAVDGKLIVTTTREGIRGLRDEGPKLSDDPLFEQAREAAGMPDETTGFAYVNLEEVVRLVLGFAEMGDESVPDELRENLEPLRTLLVYGTVEEGRPRITGFLGIE